MAGVKRCEVIGRLAVLAGVSTGLACSKAGAQEAETAREEVTEVCDVVTLRADPATHELVVELLLEDERLILQPRVVEVVAAADAMVTATIEVDAAGEVTLCPPQPEQPRVMIGVVTEPLSAALAAQLGLVEAEAIVVAEVVEGQPASEAGVCRYDVITAVDGVSPVTQDSLRERVEGSHPGDPIMLSVIRAGRRVSCEVVTRAFEEAHMVPGEASPFLLATEAWARVDYAPVHERWMAVLELTPTIVERQGLVELSLAVPLSAEARLRAEVEGVRERLAAIEAILAEMETSGQSAPGAGTE